MTTKLANFQKETIDRVLQRFSEGQNRMLVADEVGMGKTLVAKGVLLGLLKKHSKIPENKDKPFRCVYVCNNAAVAQKNIAELQEGLTNSSIAQFDRLSMVAKHISEMNNDAKNIILQLIPLTPATSFTVDGDGRKDEREFIYSALLKQFRRISSYRKDFTKEFKPINKKDIENKIKNLKIGQRFLNSIKKKAVELFENERCNKADFVSLFEDFEEMKEEEILSFFYHNCKELKDFFKKEFKVANGPKLNLKEPDFKKVIDEAKENKKSVVPGFRRLFAQIGLEMLKPDFIIMDEFQKFTSLLVNDENKMIADEFFNNKNLPILLLSATPYPKYISNQDNANQEGNNEIQRNDFSDIFDFLTGKEKGKETKGKTVNDFDNAWNEWSKCFENIMKCSAETTEDHKTKLINELKDAKGDLEKAMYDYVCRTERNTAGNKKDSEPRVELEPDTNDVLSYIQAQKILDAANLDDCRKFPIEWIKSCPYALSFMDYKLREKIEGNIKKQVKNITEFKKKYPLQWLYPVPNPDTKNGKAFLAYKKSKKSLHIYNYELGEKYPYPNAALREMVKLLFEESHSEKLLWVPPSLPYYQPEGVFKGQNNFTKTLVFSSWAVVPKMLACLLTYEAERRNVRKGVKYYPGGKEGSLTKPLKMLLTFKDWNKEPFVDNETHSLRNSRSARDWNKETFVDNETISFLVNCYSPQEHYGKELGSIIADLEKNKTNGDSLRALAAIASPAVCLYRTFKHLFKNADNEIENIAEIAIKMIHRFSTPVNRCLIEAAVEKGKNFGEKLLWYCAEGNFQAMIDEYAHMLKPADAQDLYKKMMDGLSISATSYDISVNDSNAWVGKERFKSSLRSLFAAPFLQGNGEKDANRKKHLGDAFNSPFRPFVLASTSIGQEGLDFHKYCRRIVHWNLSDNPIDFEQREGRVNRYRNLSVRQSLAARYGDILNEKDTKKKKNIWNDVWNALFEEARKKETSEEESGLIPDWILKDKDEEGKNLPKIEIESKVFLYPASKEEQKYEQLNDRLLYHVVFGQKRQEELVKKMQELGWKDENVKELMFNLSPFSKRFQDK